MHILSHFKLRTKLTLLLGLSTVALVVSIGAAASLMERRMIDDRVDKLRAITQSMIGVAQSLEDQVAAHQLTHEQALDQFRRAAHTIRFDAGAGYIVAQTLDSSMIVVHGANPGLEGKTSTAKVGDGRPLTDIIADTLRNTNEGFVRYIVAKPLPHANPTQRTVAADAEGALRFDRQARFVADWDERDPAFSYASDTERAQRMHARASFALLHGGRS